MATATVAPLPYAAERAHLRLCGIVTLETMACFALPVVALVASAAFSPFMLTVALLDPRSPWSWRPLALVVLGCAGFVGIGRLLHLVWNRPQRDARRWLTLLTIACGVGASLLQGAAIWMHRAPGGLEVLMPIVYLPLACTAHLVFLNRRALFG
jgi:hypothetical protein